MEKYILGDNIIITTKERYETIFEPLGYKPYAKKQTKNANGGEMEGIKEIKRTRKILKEE